MHIYNRDWVEALATRKCKLIESSKVTAVLSTTSLKLTLGVARSASQNLLRSSSCTCISGLRLDM